jgi:protein-tyrosine-phosphatase
MAEGFLRYKWHQMKRDDLIVSSMGIHGVTGSPATEFAQDVCKENGFDISSHIARPLVGKELLTADLILCMEPVHKKFVQVFFPWRRYRVALLGAWPDKETRKSAIQDPMGGSYKKYQKVFSLIKEHIERIIPLL